MLTKAKHFFKNPVYLLAVIVSLAVLGTGAFFALQAFADGLEAAPSDFIAEHFTTDTIDYVRLNNNRYIQVVCKDKTISKTYNYNLTYYYGNFYTLDNDYFSTSEYENYCATLTVDLPEKTFDDHRIHLLDRVVDGIKIIKKECKIIGIIRNGLF